MNRFCQSVDGSEEFLGGSVGEDLLVVSRAVSFLSGLLFSVFCWTIGPRKFFINDLFHGYILSFVYCLFLSNNLKY